MHYYVFKSVGRTELQFRSFCVEGGELWVHIKITEEAYIKGCIIDPKTFQHISKQRLYIFGDVYIKIVILCNVHVYPDSGCCLCKGI